MKRTARNIINNILAIHPYIYGLQDKLDDEQEHIIGDLCMPALKAAESLIKLNDRRVDLCNLKVLYAFIERELDGDFSVLENVALSGGDSALYDKAKRAVEIAGYTLERVKAEFAYLFKSISSGGKKKKAAAQTSAPTVYAG